MPLPTQPAPKRGAVISIFPLPAVGAKPDLPGILAFSKASGNGVDLLDYLRRILNVKGKSLNGGLFKIIDGCTIIRVFLPDGIMQAVNFSDVSTVSDCWHGRISVADFKGVMSAVSSLGLSGSNAWSRELKESFFNALPSDLDDEFKRSYFLSFSDVMNEAVFERMLAEFTDTTSDLHRGIIETISARLSKMRNKLDLVVTPEQFRSFVTFFCSQENNGKTAMLVTKLQEICGASEEQAKQFVSAFLASCYYLIYEAVAIDWLKRHASTLYYPGAITSMIQTALRMDPRKEQEKFWREPSLHLLSLTLLDEVASCLELLKSDHEARYITAAQRERIQGDLQVARAFVESYAACPRVVELLPNEFAGKQLNNLGDVYKLHQILQAHLVILQPKVLAMQRSDDVVTPPPPADPVALPSSPISAVTAGRMDGKTAIELYNAKARVTALELLVSVQRSGGGQISESLVWLILSCLPADKKHGAGALADPSGDTVSGFFAISGAAKGPSRGRSSSASEGETSPLVPPAPP